jgi:hypothetical protein
MDVENKTITHRPDMFGHFGLATEIHSMYLENDDVAKSPSFEDLFAL